MDPTIVTLARLHRDLLARVAAGDEGLRVVAETVPQLYGLVQSYAPEADAVIFSRDELRALVTAIVVDVVQAQTCRAANAPTQRPSRPAIN